MEEKQNQENQVEEVQTQDNQTEETHSDESSTEEKQSDKTYITILVSLTVLLVLIATIIVGVRSASSNKSNKSGESEETTDEWPSTLFETYALGDTFVLDDFEFTIGNANDITWTTVDNKYSGHNGANVAVLPVTIKNLRGGARSLDLFYLAFNNGIDAIDTVTYLFQKNDVCYIDFISESEPVDAAFHILYDGDSEYRIAFHNQDNSVLVSIVFQISKPDTITDPATEPDTMPDTELTTDPATEPVTEPPVAAVPNKEYTSGGSLINEPPTKQPTTQSPAAQPSNPAPSTPSAEPPKSQQAGTYTAGKYKVGVDIPAGEYFLQTASGRSGYMSVNRDSSGELNSIIENENFNTHHYITIQDGQYFELWNATAIPAKDTSKTFNASGLGEGMYRVGIDIPAGEYRLTATNGHGYVCVYDNSSAYRNIQSNNLFESNDYVTVSNGQYLLIHRCTGSIVQ